MKKIQAAILIAVVAGLLVLSGCDAVLEVFYPEFAYQSGENVISIYIGFNMYPNQLSGDNQYFVGRLVNSKSGTVVRSDPFWHWIEEKNNLYWHLEGNLDFYGVDDGDYQVEIWLEQNGDGEPGGANEPMVNATIGGMSTFAFPNTSASDGWLYGEAISPLY
jgi:hypothetical protein